MVDRILKLLSSLKLTVVLLGLAILLVFLGTIAQVHEGTASAGETVISWSRGSVRPGLYFARMIATDGAHGAKVFVQ